VESGQDIHHGLNRISAETFFELLRRNYVRFLLDISSRTHRSVVAGYITEVFGGNVVNL
jgi:ribosomal protein S17E